MALIRLTKEFHFEMAHRLGGYDGACRNIHGHSYKLSVTIVGEPIADSNHPHYGMVMDFTQLKEIVNENIIERYDHALLLNSHSCSNNKRFADLEGVLWVNYQPTCENILQEIAEIVSSHLPQGVNLHHLSLDETHSSRAEWYASDNL